MQAAIDRVMQAFTLMANLTPEEAASHTAKDWRSIWPEWTLTKRRLRLRDFATCADQTVLRGEEWRGRQHDG